MDLIILVLVLCVVGFAVWFLTNKIPMDPLFKTGIQIVVFIIVIIYVLRVLGVTLPNFLN